MNGPAAHIGPAAARANREERFGMSKANGSKRTVTPVRRSSNACLAMDSTHRASQAAQCPLYPQKRTLIERVRMSALCQKRTLAASFDHLVGAGKQCRRLGIGTKRHCETA